MKRLGSALMRKPVAAMALICLCLSPVGAAWGATTYRYIDASAATSGDGSEESPWKNISNIAWNTGANNIASDVDTGNTVIVYFKRGQTWKENLSPQKSGASESARIIFDGETWGDGEKAKIDRTGSNGACVTINKTSYTNIKGFSLINGKAGSPAYYAYNDAATPSQYNIIENCTITSDLDGSSAIRIYGPGAGGAPHNTIQNNVIYCRVNSTNQTINLNLADYTTVSGNCLYNLVDQKDKGFGVHIYDCDNCTISGNTIGSSTSDSFFTGIRIYGSSSNNSNSNIIERNTILYCWNNVSYVPGTGMGYAIQLDGPNTSNTITRYNYIAYNQRGYVDSANITGVGNNLCIYNLFYHNTTNCIDADYGGTTGYSLIYNNTVIHHVNNPDVNPGHGIVVQNGGKRAKIFNNIVILDQASPNNNVQCIYLNGTFNDIQLGNNLYYTTNGAYLGTLQTTCYTDLASWQTALAKNAAITVRDANSLQTDPLLDSNYHLRADSPCINAGIVAAGVHDQAEPATDLAGTRVLTIPDIGAYEYSPQQLYFNSNATGALENGTEEHPYHAFTDYPGASSGAFSAYSLRSGAELILAGSLGDLDLSGLSDDGAIQIEAADGANTTIASFSPNGPYTFFSLSVVSPEAPALPHSWLFILLLSMLAIYQYHMKS